MQAIQTPARIAISNILLTTDFSKASSTAVPYASALARMFGAKVYVAHAVSPEPTYLGIPLDRLPHEADPAWQEARRHMVQFLEKNSLGDVPHEEILERGELWDVVSDIIARNRIDLIILGAHGRQGFGKLILGSGAETLYRQAPCPVLMVGPEAGVSGRPYEPRQILFPTDLSENSLHALPYALSLAEENDASLTLLHLVPLIPWQQQPEVTEKIQKQLSALVPEEAKLWCKPESMVRFEFPVEGILNVARERHADVIVMGIKQSGKAQLASHLPWTVTSEVVSEAPCPVLTVRS